MQSLVRWLSTRTWTFDELVLTWAAVWLAAIVLALLSFAVLDWAGPRLGGL